MTSEAKKPKALDLFCGAGGASMGLHQAGFDVTGVDIRPQPRYPFRFAQADAMEYPLDGYAFIWASPPCQRYSEATPITSRAKHPDLIAPVRERLTPYTSWVIENVDGARDLLVRPFMLCGTMFGLKVWRHRWFEVAGFSIPALRTPCNHTGYPVLVCGSGHGRGEAKPAEMISAMEVPWMAVRKEARQAIPPAYSKYIGEFALQHISHA